MTKSHKPFLATVVSIAFLMGAVTTGANAQQGNSGGNGQPFQALQNNIDAVESNLQGQIDGMGGQINGLQGQINDLGGQINTLNSIVGNLGQQINNLGVTVGSLGGQINNLQNQLNGLGGQINSLSGQVNTLGAQINSVEANLQAQIDGLAGGTGQPTASQITQIRLSGPFYPNDEVIIDIDGEEIVVTMNSGTASGSNIVNAVNQVTAALSAQYTNVFVLGSGVDFSGFINILLNDADPIPVDVQVQDNSSLSGQNMGVISATVTTINF